MPGMGELLIILLIVMVIFGAGKLPAIGQSLGSAIKNFKRASSGDDELEVSKQRALEGQSANALSAGTRDVEDAELLNRRHAKKEA